jgi:hypothetical protein
MKSRRLLPAACVAFYASLVGAQTQTWTPDPAGDSKGGPDLVAVSAVTSGGVLTLRARFALHNFDPKTTRVVWVLDTGQNTTTGSPVSSARPAQALPESTVL